MKLISQKCVDVASQSQMLSIPHERRAVKKLFPECNTCFCVGKTNAIPDCHVSEKTLINRAEHWQESEN